MTGTTITGLGLPGTIGTMAGTMVGIPGRIMAGMAGLTGARTMAGTEGSITVRMRAAITIGTAVRITTGTKR